MKTVIRILVAMLFTASTQSMAAGSYGDSDAVLGTWQDTSGGQIVFFADSAVLVAQARTSMSGTFFVQKDILKMTFKMFGSEATMVCNYSVSRERLTLSAISSMPSQCPMTGSLTRETSRSGGTSGSSTRSNETVGSSSSNSAAAVAPARPGAQTNRQSPKAECLALTNDTVRHQALRDQEAIPLCQAAHKMEPIDTAIMLALVRVLNKAGRDAEAIEFVNLAIRLGNIRAISQLGNLTFSGRGVPKSESEALTLWRKAADAGDALGQINLAGAYQTGRIVPKNLAEAVRLFGLASDSGYGPASRMLAKMHEKGEGVPQSYANMHRLLVLATEQGDAEAWNDLGAAYFVGRGVPKDHNKAKSYWTMGAERGSDSAQDNLVRNFARR